MTMDARWDWSRNAQCTEIEVTNGMGNGTIGIVHALAELTMDPRLQLARRRMLMDVSRAMTCMMSTWEETVGDRMLDILVVMDLTQARSAVGGFSSKDIEYFVEYRFAGEFNHRIELSSPGSAAVAEWSGLLGSHEQITTGFTDRVLAGRKSVIRGGVLPHLTYTPGPAAPVAGGLIGYTPTGRPIRGSR